ncbi:MAG: inositol monophosphatase family protein [Waddliaceae bacterium]
MTLAFAHELAKASGVVLKNYWGKLKNIQSKSNSYDLVTEADQESEAIIIQMIQDAYPSHQILSEESGLTEKKEAEYLWIIDPLDGTTNYTHQYPWFAVSIALYHEGSPILGIVYNPIYEELFEAEKGKGAKLNNQTIQVSKTETLEKSLLATGFAYNRMQTKENNYQEFFHLTNRTQGVRRCGAASLDLAYVAAGRLDGYWERGLAPWDTAAGILLVQEAGGIVSSYENAPFDPYSGRILSSNGKIHDPLHKQLMEASRLEN